MTLDDKTVVLSLSLSESYAHVLSMDNNGSPQAKLGDGIHEEGHLHLPKKNFVRLRMFRETHKTPHNSLTNLTKLQNSKQLVR